MISLLIGIDRNFVRLMVVELSNVDLVRLSLSMLCVKVGV